jgi:drug/metabolite transporter (DMT)-like permease
VADRLPCPMCDIGKMRLNRTSRPLGFLACAAAGSLWGTGFFFGKIALGEMSVGHMVLYRFLFAMPVALPIALRQLTRWTRRDWIVLAVSAFFGIPLQFLVQFQGLSLTTVAHASLMVGTMPVVLAAAAAIFLHERLDALGWFALATSTVGACLIALAGDGGGGASLMGDLLVVTSLVIALVWILGNKDLLNRHGALAVTSRSLVLGTVMLAVWVCLRDGLPPARTVSPHAWAALAASGLLCTAATTALWNWGLTQVPASQAGVFLNLEPVIGSALGVWFFHERLGPAAWAGGGLIVGSALLLTMRDPTAQTAAELVAAE